MTSLKDRLVARFNTLRKRRPAVDHVVRMVQHYGTVNGNLQAGAVTYFAFLSFFPILALAFFTVGIIAKVYSGAEQDLIDAIGLVLPNVVGDGPGEISLEQVQSFSGWAAVLGVAGVLFAGLSWLSAMRNSLEEVFERPHDEQPSFVIGKLRDLASLVLIGLVLMVAVVVAGFVTGFSDVVLGWLHLSSQLSWLVYVITRLVGLAANAVLFFVMFRLLGSPQSPPRALWSGALLGAVLFEILKSLSFLLLASTEGKPAFQAFGIALILLVWIYYFSRIVMYAASWAHTAPAARAERAAEEPADPVQGPRSPTLLLPDTVVPERTWMPPFVAGSALTLAVVALVRRRGSDRA